MNPRFRVWRRSSPTISDRPRFPPEAPLADFAGERKGGQKVFFFGLPIGRNEPSIPSLAAVFADHFRSAKVPAGSAASGFCGGTERGSKGLFLRPADRP